MSLGERIKTIRGKTSRDRFAPQTGISKTALVNYETGSRDPGVDYLVKLLSLFPNISPAWLLTGEGDMQRGKSDGLPIKLDDTLLVSVISAVEEYLEEVNGHLHPAKKAQLLVTLYDMFAGDEAKAVDKTTVIRLVRLAA